MVVFVSHFRVISHINIIHCMNQYDCIQMSLSLQTDAVDIAE